MALGEQIDRIGVRARQSVGELLGIETRGHVRNMLRRMEVDVDLTAGRTKHFAPFCESRETSHGDRDVASEQSLGLQLAP